MKPAKLVLVGGIGRSGTSITGRLIASSKRTEYFYEPAVPFYLIDRVDKFEKEEWKRLFEISIYKDLLKNSLAGRNINLNPHDTSSIRKYKSKDIINKKHSRSYNQTELAKMARRSTVVLKILDNIYKHDRLENILSNFYSVIIFRNPKDTTNSLLKKGWFSDYQLSTKSPKPARTLDIHDEMRVHQFIKESKELDDWIRMKEYQRVGHYYKWHIKKFIGLNEYNNVIFISYDEMVNKSEETKNLLFSKLDLIEGELASEVVDSIQTSTAIRENYQAPFSEEEKAKMQDLFDQLAGFAINTQ